MIEELLFKVGIPTYKTNLITEITATNTVNLGQQAPTNIGWIYGISLNVAGTSATTNANGQTLVTLLQAANLWLNLKIGTNVFIQNTRLSNFVYQQPNVTRTQEKNYVPVSIPLDLDWKQSQIVNPTLMSAVFVDFDFWYIDKQSYANLLKSGALWQTGNKPQV